MFEADYSFICVICIEFGKSKHIFVKISYTMIYRSRFSVMSLGCDYTVIIIRFNNETIYAGSLRF